MKVKKIISLFLSAVMAVTAAAALAVSASAEDVKELTSGDQLTISLDSAGKNYGYDYKINVAKKGTLTIALSSNIRQVNIKVTDTESNTIKSDKTKDTLGSSKYVDKYEGTAFYWNTTELKYKGSVTYTLEKGTYYVKIYRWYNGNYGATSNKVTFKATFPTAEEESKITFTSFVLPMKVGDTTTLGTDLSDTTQTITWKSSKTSVATVTKKGKITAKAAGTATITATVGSTSIKIIIKVTK